VIEERKQDPPDFMEEEEFVEISEKRFLLKIPEVAQLKDFFINAGGYYLPPDRDLTNDFCTVIFIMNYFLLI